MILRHRRNCNEEKSSVLYHLRYDSIIIWNRAGSGSREGKGGDTSGIENDIGDYLLKNSTFVKELPTPFVNRNTSTLKDQLQNYADTYKMSLADFMKYYDSSLTEDTYEEYIQKLGADYSKKLVAMQAIADAEDLAVTDEELKEQIKTQAEAAGFSDVDEYKSAAKMDPEELREVMMSTKVFEFLEGKVTFNKK